MQFESEGKYYNIWKEACKNKTQRLKQDIPDKTLIFVGTPQSGKSSLIRVLRSGEEVEIKPTGFIDYCSFKRLSAKREIINAYEIASRSQCELIECFITKENFASVVFVVCCDLSKPGSILSKLLEDLEIIRQQSQLAIAEKLSLFDAVSKHHDNTLINPIPFKTVIVATKYDYYERYDLENRKWLCKMLRYVANSNWCSLYTVSCKNEQYIAQFRSVMDSSLFFEKREPQFKLTDYQKPFFVSPGEDDFASIGVPSSGSLKPLDVLRKQLGMLFSEEETIKKEDPNFEENYREYRIDTLVDEKRKDLQRIRKNIRNSALFQRR